MPQFRTLMVYTLVILGSQSAVAEDKVPERQIFDAKCLLEIDGTKYIDGTCRVVMGKYEVFQLSSKTENGPFVRVGPDPDNTGNYSVAEAYWNGPPPYASLANTSLGRLTLNVDDCWINSKTKICWSTSDQ